MTATTTRRSGLLRDWSLWTAGFLVFPVAGLAGRAFAGPVDHLAAALLGGAMTGLVLGIGQALLGRGAVPRARWIAATTLGMAIGLALGASVVGYGTSLGELALMGVLTGAPLGIAQAVALPASTRRRVLWAAATPALWGAGWAVTTLAGIDVDAQFTLFGISGAVVVSAVSGLVLVGPSRRQES